MVLDNKIGSVLVRATHGGEVSSSRNMLVPVPGAVRGMKSWLTGEGDVRNEGATVVYLILLSFLTCNNHKDLW